MLAHFTNKTAHQSEQFHTAKYRPYGFLQVKNRSLPPLCLAIIYLFLSACHSRSETTLNVRNSAQEYIDFEYAILHLPYYPSDSLSAPQYIVAATQTVSLEISEPTFIAVRTKQKQQDYILLLSPKDRAELQLLPLGYTVNGSLQSMRICELNQIFKNFNDSLQLLKRNFEWTYTSELEHERRQEILRSYDTLVAHTRLCLMRFIAQEPLSKANLLALQAHHNGNDYFFTTPRDRIFAREIASRIVNSYNDTLLAVKIVREYTDER